MAASGKRSKTSRLRCFASLRMTLDSPKTGHSTERLGQRHGGGVILSSQNAVRRNSDCPLFFALSFLIILLLAAPGAYGQVSNAGGTSLDELVQQLADRVSGIPNLRGPLRVQYFQEAGFAAETGKDWQDAFRKELEKSRLTLTEDTGANLLRVGLAKTPTEVVLSAGVRLNDKEETRFVTMARTAFAVPNVAVSPIRVDQQLVYQSMDRILDAAFATDDTGPGLVILANRPAGLVVVRVGGAGEVEQSVSLTGAGVRASRDSDGELQLRGNDVDVVFVAKACHFSWTSAQDVVCHMAKGVRRAAVVLKPPCGDGSWRLAGDGTDWYSPELLQVVPDGSVRKGSAALLSNFPGPILNVSAGVEQNADSALVATRNLRTGNYEVYKVTLACGN